PSSDFGENQLSRGLISLSLLLSSHLRIFQHPRVRSSTWCYPGFNLLKSRSPPLRVYCPRLIAHFALGFPSPPLQSNLGSPWTITRRLIMQKAGRHPLEFTIYDLRFKDLRVGWPIHGVTKCASLQDSLTPLAPTALRTHPALRSHDSRVNRKSKIANSRGLRHIVCIWLQVLFHSPNRGSFHLSLAVLVHYRLPRSI